MIGRAVRGLWSAAWVLVFLLGVPYGLVRYIGWPLPTRWPTGAQWQDLARQPLTPGTLLASGTIIAWLLWLLLLYAVAVEILTRIRRVSRLLRRWRLPPLPTPMQATASGILGAAVFGMPTAAAHAPAPPPAPPPAGPILPTAAPTAATTTPPTAGDQHAAPPATPASIEQRQPDDSAGGVVLPDGGWISEPTAQAIAATGALVWWRRRRDYQPRPPTGAHRDDADLTPLPPTVDAVHDALHSEDPDGSIDAVTVGAEPARPTRARDWSGALLLPAGGVGMTGVGAHAAARGILTTQLLSAATAPAPDTAAPQVITTAADLDTLLGPDANRHAHTPALTVTATLEEAIAVLERHTLTRSRTTRDPDRHTDTATVDVAPLLLLTCAPTQPATAIRLAVLLLGAHLGINAVLLGAWPHGETWPIDADGHTRGDPSAERATTTRLNTLTPAAAADVLTVLRLAAGEPPQRTQPTAQELEAPETHPAVTAPANEPTSAPSAAAVPNRPATSRSPSTPLRLRLLGTPHLSTANGTDVSIQRTAAHQILIFLAIHHPHGATSSNLIAALWPGPRPKGAPDRLYTPISKLRATLRAAAGADVLIRDGDRYRLHDQHIDVDLWRLFAAVDQAGTAIDPTRRRAALRHVLDLYTGELAARRNWSWLTPPREAIRRHIVDAYVALAADQPNPREAATLLQDAVHIDPANADLRRRAHHAHTMAQTRP